jgi:hypothetical protein
MSPFFLWRFIPIFGFWTVSCQRPLVVIDKAPRYLVYGQHDVRLYCFRS